MQNANVRLRPITLDDAIHYERLLGDDWDAIKTTATIPCPCTEAAAREWLAPRMQMPNRLFAILRQPDDEFVGAIGLVATNWRCPVASSPATALHAIQSVMHPRSPVMTARL